MVGSKTIESANVHTNLFSGSGTIILEITDHRILWIKGPHIILLIKGSHNITNFFCDRKYKKGNILNS